MSLLPLRFSGEERRFIVDNLETDLVLTTAGLKLVDGYSKEDGFAVIGVSQSEYEEFVADLREEYLWKATRISNAACLVALAKRFLPDFASLEPMEFG
ncbi:MAG: hypothetical protein KF833_09675 [Verrucomicrobiae bacterium]|nr:hypothetical protein [Verrucomicrobiae bacterium]